MPNKKLSQTLNEFVNILVEEELEPIRLDLIRVENDMKADIDEKFDTLKSAIEKLAARVSDAIDEQVEQYAEIVENLSERIAALEKKN